MIEQLLQNAVFQGVGAAAILTGAMAMAWRLVGRIWPRLVWLAHCKLVCRERSIAYGALVSTLTAAADFRRIRTFRLGSYMSSNGLRDFAGLAMPAERRGDERMVLELEIGEGTHFVRWRGAWFRVDRELEKDEHGFSQGEKTTVSTAWFWRDRLKALVDHAQGELARRRSSHFAVYATRGFGEWSLLTFYPKRAMETVILPPGDGERVLADMRRFLASEDWYRVRGVPYRRGYGFFGSPGEGKTSLVVALASALDMDVAFLPVGSIGEDADLAQLFARLPGNSVLVIEDVDRLTKHGELPERSLRFRGEGSPAPMPGKAKAPGNLTLAGLLNALDGLIAGYGRIIVMTSNHPERLDAALLRPGRIDMRLDFAVATHDQAARLYRLFYPKEPRHKSEQFAMLLLSQGPSTMAMVYQALMQLRPATTVPVAREDVTEAIADSDFAEVDE